MMFIPRYEDIPQCDDTRQTRASIELKREVVDPKPWMCTWYKRKRHRTKPSYGYKPYGELAYGPNYWNNMNPT